MESRWDVDPTTSSSHPFQEPRQTKSWSEISRPSVTLPPVPRYKPQSRDTTEAIDRQVFEGFRKMTPLQRLKIASQASLAVHRLSVAGLRLRYPEASEEELFRRAGALRLGRELTLKTFGPEAESWLE